MRVFYVFKINRYFSDMYKNNPYKIYKLLQEIHYIRDYNIRDTRKKLEQIINFYDKDNVNNNLIDKLYSYKDYFNKENVHIICDNYEYTKLVVEDSVIKIKTNQKYPSIINYLEDDNIFVCDFVNRDFFWLKLEKSIA